MGNDVVAKVRSHCTSLQVHYRNIKVLINDQANDPKRYKKDMDWAIFYYTSLLKTIKVAHAMANADAPKRKKVGKEPYRDVL